MKVTPVESCTLATVGYDEGGELLQLEFRSRAIYRYFAVPATVYATLLAAVSKGSYVNQAIRGHYRFVRVDRLRPVEEVPGPVPCACLRGVTWPAR